MSRRLGRGGGTTLPGPHAAAARQARDRRGSAARLEARHRAALGHERQDHDRVDDRRRSSSAPGRPVVRNARRVEHALGRRDGAARRRPPARRARPVRGRRGLAARGRAASSTPDTFVLCNLFRDQLDRYGELELLADRWAELVAERAGSARFVLNADDPLVADLGRERDGRRLLRRRRRLAGAARAAARRRLEALPQLRARRTSTRPSTWATSAATAARTAAAQRPEPRGRRRAGRARRDDGLARVAARRRRGRSSSRLPLPGLYNVYNAVAAAAAALELGASLERREGVARGAGRRLRPRRDDPGRRPRRLDPARQEPGRRERGAAHADARGRRSSTCGSR